MNISIKEHNDSKFIISISTIGTSTFYSISVRNSETICFTVRNSEMICFTIIIMFGISETNRFTDLITYGISETTCFTNDIF